MKTTQHSGMRPARSLYYYTDFNTLSSQLSSIDGKMRITEIPTEQSIGTGVITNK